MRYTEEQLTSACMAFSDRLWHVGWSEASEAHRMGVRKAMLEALSTLPDPQPGPMPTMGIDYREQHKQERGRWENLRDAQIRQIKALEKKSKRLEDELGRANCERDEARAEVERWRQRHADVEEQLRSAVAQGVADSESHAAVPFQVTADEAIAATKTMATQYPERNAKVRWEDVADSVNEQLQKRQPIPVPSDAVRDALVWLWCAYPQITERPARWQVRNAMLALGDGPHEDEQDSAASGEAERIAELEAKLAAVTEERDRLSVSARNSYHDGYRDSQSQRHAADERARVAADERDEALLKSERAQVSCTAAIDDARKACAARDEALAKLANVEAEADHHAQERESLRSQLAARPEPVVIDEALAERVFDAYYRAHGLSGGPAMLVGLRSVFGAHASVSVPQGDESAAGLMVREERDRLRLERDQLRAELANRADPVYVSQLQEEVTRLRADLAACRVERDTWLAEHGRVTAELDVVQSSYENIYKAHQRAIAELEACKRNRPATREEWERLCWQEGHVQAAYRLLLETLDQHVGDMEEDAQATIENDAWQRGRRDACAMYAQRLRALFKPATPEPQPVPWADMASPTDEERARLGVPLQQPPHEAAMVEPAACTFCGPNFLGTCPHRPSMGVKPRHVSPEEMAQATEEARDLRIKLDKATAGMEGAVVEPPASLREAWSAIEALRESLETAWAAIEALDARSKT